MATFHVTWAVYLGAVYFLTVWFSTEVQVSP